MIRHAIGASLVLAALGAPAARAQTFTRVLQSGDPVPGTGATIFAFSEAPALNGDHLATLIGYTDGGAAVSAVLSNAGGAFQVVAKTGDPMPGFFATPLEFLLRLTADGDHVAFQGSSFAGGVVRNAVVTNAGGALISVADTLDLIPQGSGFFTQIASQDFSFGDGMVAFNGSGNSGQRGVYRVAATGGPIHRVADNSTPVPGGGAAFSTFGSPAVRDGRIAFSASFPGGGGVYELPDVAAPGLVELVAAGGASPSGPPFSFLFGARVDEDDTLFYGIAGGAKGLHAIVNGALKTIADAATPIPGGAGAFPDFDTYAISNDRVIFYARDFNAGPVGVFTDVCGALAPVLVPGDALDGRVVATVLVDEDSLDGDRLACHVLFTDGSSGIYVADLTAIDALGSGHAPAGTTPPTLEGIGCPDLGATLTFHLREAPANAPGLLVVGTQPAAVPVPSGGSLLVLPLVTAPLHAAPPTYGIPSGWQTFTQPIPNDAGLSGVTFRLQAIWAEPGFPGFSRLSPALRVPIP